MDTGLVLLAIGLLATFHLMSVITLKNRLESVEKGLGKQKDYWKSVESSITIQSNQISNEIQNAKTFNDNAFVAMNESITASSKHVTKEVIAVVQDCDYSNASRNAKLSALVRATNKNNDENYSKLSEQLEGHDEDVACDCEVLKVCIKELGEKMDKSTRDINFITKQQAGRVITTPLRVMMEKHKVEDER